MSNPILVSIKYPLWIRHQPASYDLLYSWPGHLAKTQRPLQILQPGHSDALELQLRATLEHQQALAPDDQPVLDPIAQHATCQFYQEL